MLKNKRLFWICIIILLLVAAFSFRLHKIWRAHREKPLQTPQVILAPVAQANVPVLLSALGTVTPNDTVIIKTQVDGRLLHVFFKEGQTVKAGELLAEIDPRVFQAQLLQYQGQRVRDTAQLSNARVDLKRYQMLWRQNAIAKQTLDTQASLVKQYEGALKIDEGLISGVRVNLKYCRIEAPIAGRIGLQHVDEGNVVKTSDPDGLAVINTLDPISVMFSIPEEHVPELMKYMKANTLTVQAYDRKGERQLANGVLLTTDNQMDPSTGTIKLKAEFSNPDTALFPNQFVNVRLHLCTLNNVAIVPTAAIQQSAQGAFVYRLNQDHTVSHRKIVTGVVFGEYTVVQAGLAFHQLVVVEGADKLTDGMKVDVAVTKSLLVSHG